VSQGIWLYDAGPVNAAQGHTRQQLCFLHGANSKTKEHAQMKRLQTILLAMMAILSLGAVVASAASAAEKPGLLPLPKTTFPAAGVPFTSTSGEGKLNTAANKPITCSADTDEGTIGGKTGETEHITLGTVVVTFTGCKQEGLQCRSEQAGKKDPAGTILVGLPGEPADIHFVALLNGTKLVPGILVILLKTVVINCGGFITEVKGTATGEVTNVTAGTDFEKFTANFIAKPLPCDETDTLCKEQLGKGLRAELGKGEEAAEEVTEDKNTPTEKEMFLFDF
jgi:hypothetical protein